MSSPEGTNAITTQRCRAAIATIEHLALEVQAVCRGDQPPEVTARIRQIRRLMTETTDILRRRLLQLESPPVA